MIDGKKGSRMNIVKVTPEEYEKLVPDRRVFFNEPRFCELNKYKVNDVYYLIIKKDQSPRFGVILGKVGEEGQCPFSAPYSYPVEIKPGQGVSNYDEALETLENFCNEENIKSLKITFPPLFYDENQLSAWISALYRGGYQINSMDINYALDLKKLNQDNYEQLIGLKARKHLRKAFKTGISVSVCETETEFAEAYEIVKLNHDAKGRPTRMTFEQLLDTVALTDYKAFIAKLNEKSIASMIYYRINKKVIQCIYSGLLPGYENSGAMNYLSWYAIKYFGDAGYDTIDRATATEDSVPNYGLCDFKESIGCTRSLKYTFSKEL